MHIRPGGARAPCLGFEPICHCVISGLCLRKPVPPLSVTADPPAQRGKQVLGRPGPPSEAGASRARRAGSCSPRRAQPQLPRGVWASPLQLAGTHSFPGQSQKPPQRTKHLAMCHGPKNESQRPGPLPQLCPFTTGRHAPTAGTQITCTCSTQYMQRLSHSDVPPPMCTVGAHTHSPSHLPRGTSFTHNCSTHPSSPPPTLSSSLPRSPGRDLAKVVWPPPRVPVEPQVPGNTEDMVWPWSLTFTENAHLKSQALILLPNPDPFPQNRPHLLSRPPATTLQERPQTKEGPPGSASPPGPE